MGGLSPIAQRDPGPITPAPAAKEEGPKSGFRVDTKGTHITFFAGENIYTITPNKNLNKEQLEKICKAFQKAFEEDESKVIKHIQLAAGQNVGQFAGSEYKDRSYKRYEYVFTDQGIEFRRFVDGSGDFKLKDTIPKVDEAARGAIRLNVEGPEREHEPIHPRDPARGPAHARPEEDPAAAGGLGGPGAADGAARPSQEERIRNAQTYLDSAERLLEVLGRDDSLNSRIELERCLTAARDEIEEIRGEEGNYTEINDRFEQLIARGLNFKPLDLAE